MRNLINNTLNKRGRLLAVVMSFIMLFSSVSNGAEAATKKLKVTSPKTVTVKGTIKIKTNMKCKFKSSNKKIATVSSKGVVKGKKAGKVKITVTAKKNKQKKTVKITVKKQAKKVVTKTPSTSEPETTPTVIATHPPQGGVPQTPKPPEGVTQTPSVPEKSSNPSTLPNIPKTPNPSTSLPRISATPGQSTTPPAIPTSNVPSTQKPSVSSAPTRTATPSPTNPSTTRKPVGITAEFEGKIPINRTLSYEAISMATIFEYNIVVKLEYDDNSYEVIPKQKIDIDGSKDKSIVEEGEKKYIDTKVTFEKFTTILRVELVDVPENVIYPDELMCSYTGGKIKENGFPDKEDIQVQAVNIDGTAPYINSNEISMLLTYDDIEEKKYEFWIQYDYYFDYNGEKMHTTSGAYIWVPYE